MTLGFVARRGGERGQHRPDAIAPARVAAFGSDEAHAATNQLDERYRAFQAAANVVISF